MNKFQYLSYYLDDKTPIYGGSSGIKIKPLSKIENGDSANTKELILHNHSGTHIDFPNHFISDGKLSNDYDANFWIFNNPHLIKIEARENEIISSKNFKIDSIPSNTDFLIINTGFYKKRNTKEFWNNNPGFDPKLARILKSRCPKLKVLGMDSISLTSYQNRILGKKSHKEFLGANDILIIEDMNLNNLSYNILRIFCFPLLVKGIDGAPVTIIAQIDE